MKKVSVVIPVYNGKNYLARAIESVRAQDYPNIELVVVNGESTDNTQQIAEFYDVKTVQGKLYSLPNWSVAMQAADGDFVKMLCHDDTLMPDCISKQVKRLEENPNVIMVSCQRQYIDKNSEPLETKNPIGQDVNISGKEALAFMLARGNYIGETSCVLFKNTKIVFPEKLNWLLDMYMWAELLAKGDFYYIAQPLVNIRIHSEQDTHRVMRDPDYRNKEASDILIIGDVYRNAYK